MSPLLVVGDGRWKEDDPRNPCVHRSRIVNGAKEKKIKCKHMSHALLSRYIIPMV